MIDQTVILLAQVPAWLDDNFGFKTTRNTVFRWGTRGCQGKKLKIFRVGGRVCTSVERLLEFLNLQDDAAVPRAGSEDSYEREEF